MINTGVTVMGSDYSKDLSVSYSDADTGATLIGAICSGLGGRRVDVMRVQRTGAIIDPHQLLGRLDLLHGDVIDAEGAAAPPRSRARLRRTGKLGPDVIEISGAGLRVGRLAFGNDLVLDDGTVSKMHAAIAVRGPSVVLEDLRSLNGTRVQGAKIDGPRVLRNGDAVDFGEDSTFTFEMAESEAMVPRAGWATLGDHLQRSAGRLYVSRSWRAMRTRPNAIVTIDAAPDRVSSRRFPVPMLVLPVVLGVAIVALTGNYMFLAFGALGPLMAVWNWWDDRRSGVKQYKSASKLYLDRVESARAEADLARVELRDWLEWMFPSTELLSNRALCLEPTIWDRHYSHPDFLEVRIGTGRVSTTARVEASDRGAPELVSKARELKEAHAVDPDMAVTVRLNEIPVLALVGSSERLRMLGRSLIVQLAVRNSPNDVRIACLGGDWSWASWLPHASAQDQPPLIGANADSIGRVVQEIEARITNVTQRGGSVEDHVVLIIEPPILIPPARLNSILAKARLAKISIVWLADASGPPPESIAVVALEQNSTLRVGASAAIRLDAIEATSLASAAAVARSLAPVIDPGSSTEGTIPDRVGLLDVIGADCCDPDAVLAKWRQPHDERLLAAMGVGKDGIITLDLSNEGDGPNGLVGGTVGAGKSEFLQSLVLALATHYGPDELNFLFVDFKGGATFESLLGLPHVVGMVCNLDVDQASRAQKSLQAEFRRRQQILPANKVQKMSELRAKAPDKALPALVVIIDEYAELAQKLPEFLEAVVELAQTGRALGLHLLLATQAPGQSVSGRIKNCVKYRISFRLKDRSESVEVLGKGADASALPNRPGRGYFLDGFDELHEFQGAWAGGRSMSDHVDDVSAVTLYGRKKLKQIEGATDLERVVAGVIEANDRGAYPAPRRPWHEPLPARIPFNRLDVAEPVPGANRLRLGTLDLPSSQLQSPYDWSLAESPNLLVYGDARSGKTSLLRTIAASASTLVEPGHVELLGFDAAGGGLGSIDELPNVRGVVQSQDTAGLRRAIAHLRSEEELRRAQIGRAGSLQAHRRASGESIPDLIVLVDGLAQLLNALEVIDGGSVFNAFNQLTTDGAPVGIHFVLATDQPQRVPMSIRNTAREKLTFRLANRDAASAAEVHRSTTHLPDGRAYSALYDGDVQIAVLGDGADPDGPVQASAIKQIAANLQSQGFPQTARPRQPLPTVRPHDVPEPVMNSHQVIVGLDDLFVSPVAIDLLATPTLAICGPDLSGRTSSISWVAQSLKSSIPELVTIYVAGRGDPPPGAANWTHVFHGFESFLETLEAFVATIEEHGSVNPPLLVAIDDCDEMIANPIGLAPAEVQLRKRLATAMDAVHRAGRNACVTTVIAGRLSGLSSAVPWAQRFKQNQQALLLAPASLDITVTDPVFQVPLPRRTGFRPTPGSAIVLRRGEPPRLVQMVLAGEP